MSFVRLRIAKVKGRLPVLVTAPVLPTILMLFGTCVLRIVWVYAVCPVWKSFDTIMMVYPISWVLTGVMVCTAFAMTMNKITREKRRQASATAAHATITE